MTDRDNCRLAPLKQPCGSCPWRVDARASDIPGFDMDLAVGLAKNCPDARGHGPEFGAAIFACHLSTERAEFACAGWLAAVGAAHPGVRLAIITGRLSPTQLQPGPDWPTLHASYHDVLRKLEETQDPPTKPEL